MIGRVKRAISGDETRPHINSMLLEALNGRLIAAATDGHRMTCTDVPLPKNASAGTWTLMLPKAGVDVLHKLLVETVDAAAKKKTSSPELNLRRSSTHAFFDFAGLTFIAKLTDAQFPPYRTTIPAQIARSVRSPREVLAETVQAIALVNEKSSVDLRLRGNLVEVSAVSPEGSGTAFDQLSVDHAGADPATPFRVSATYLRDALDAAGGEEVLLDIPDALPHPLVVRPAVETDGETTIAVVMGMML
jgi:DNA polymerase-3 subunit beta